MLLFYSYLDDEHVYDADVGDVPVPHELRPQLLVQLLARLRDIVEMY